MNPRRYVAVVAFVSLSVISAGCSATFKPDPLAYTIDGAGTGLTLEMSGPSACEPAAAIVEESASEIVVRAELRDASGGGFRKANIEVYYVSLRLQRPLGRRVVRDVEGHEVPNKYG